MTGAIESEPAPPATGHHNHDSGAGLVGSEVGGERGSGNSQCRHPLAVGPVGVADLQGSADFNAEHASRNDHLGIGRSNVGRNRGVASVHPIAAVEIGPAAVDAECPFSKRNHQHEHVGKCGSRSTVKLDGIVATGTNRDVGNFRAEECGRVDSMPTHGVNAHAVDVDQVCLYARRRRERHQMNAISRPYVVTVDPQILDGHAADESWAHVLENVAASNWVNPTSIGASALEDPELKQRDGAGEVISRREEDRAASDRFGVSYRCGDGSRVVGNPITLRSVQGVLDVEVVAETGGGYG